MGDARTRSTLIQQERSMSEALAGRRASDALEAKAATLPLWAPQTA